LKESSEQLSQIDWPNLWSSLYSYALKLVGGVCVVLNHGISAEDLVEETLLEFFASSNRLGWKADKGKLSVFLKTRLRWRLIDQIRSAPALIDLKEVNDQKAGNPDPYGSAVFQMLRDRLMERTRGHPDEDRLNEFILAASMIGHGGSKINQQIADLMLTEVSEVVNLRKKLQRLVRDINDEWKER